jgi:hypothetical protein
MYFDQRIETTSIQCFCTSKETVARIKTQLTEWAQMFTSYLVDKILISRTYKELKKLNSQRTNNPTNKWPNELNR